MNKRNAIFKNFFINKPRSSTWWGVVTEPVSGFSIASKIIRCNVASCWEDVLFSTEMHCHSIIYNQQWGNAILSTHVIQNNLRTAQPAAWPGCKNCIIVQLLHLRSVTVWLSNYIPNWHSYYHFAGTVTTDFKSIIEKYQVTREFGIKNGDIILSIGTVIMN